MLSYAAVSCRSVCVGCSSHVLFPPPVFVYVVLYALLLLSTSVSVRACLCPQRSALGEADACDAVAMVMAMFPDHRLIQVEACRAVEALADGNEDNVRLLGDAVSFFGKNNRTNVIAQDVWYYIHVYRGLREERRRSSAKR